MLSKNARNGLGFICLIILITVFAAVTEAGGTKQEQKSWQKQDQRQEQLQQQEVKQAVDQQTVVGAEQQVTMDGGDDTLTAEFHEGDTIGGDTISLNNTQFYSLGVTFPGALKCFTGRQGGGSGNDGNQGYSAFLGFHVLNVPCWMDHLTSKERDIDIHAALKCHDKHFRNAVAHDIHNRGEFRNKKEHRRNVCIDRKAASGRALMEEHRQYMQRLQECHDRIDDANERTQRCTEAFIYEQEK